jgi:hypothetical protein
MHRVMYVFLFFICSSCFLIKNKKSLIVVNPDLFKVIKVDSIQRFYFVYASKKGEIFKIVSEKKINSIGIEVKVGGVFLFKINEWRANIKMASIYSPSTEVYAPYTDLGVSCFDVGDNSPICREKESNFVLYSAENLDGLKFKE